MTDQIREQASWRKGKTPVMMKYIADHAKLFAEIAGRGFLSMPGYAYEAENELELMTKLGLSDLNYKILSETIEREMKQAGITYDLSYKAAALAWDVDKQALMTAWDAELCLIKQGMASDEETLARLAIEVAARQIVLLEAKTALDLQMEAYRLELAELEGSTSGLEISLANAKVLTATKKLELLPIFQEILAKEQELLTSGHGKVAAYTALMAAEQETATKKQQLIPGYQELANLTTAYAGLIPGQISIEEQIAGEKLAQAQAITTKEESKLEELNTEIDTANLQVDTNQAKRNLQTTQFNNQQTLTGTELNNENQYQNATNASYGRIISDERATSYEILSAKQGINGIQNNTKLDSARKLITAEIAADKSVNAAGIYGDGRVATIRAETKLTAALEHIIG